MTVVATNPETDAPEREPLAGWTGRLEAVEAFIMLLARAVRQVHAYPIASQVVLDAVTACLSHLVAIDGPDEISLTVAPDTLLLHDHPLGEAPFVRHELTRRLRRARVTQVTINRDATARDLTRLCVNLLRCSESADRSLSVAAFMTEDGVEAVQVQVTARREVLDVGASAGAQRDLIAHERRRREESPAANTRMVHLFPPHRGWIRLDPAESFDAVTLSDLAILVEDPTTLAGMLQRLVGDAEPTEEANALERRFSDVSALFAGLEPRLGRMMFAKLARVVLGLDPGRRQDLLKRTILPAIFDGRFEATVLHAFPDPELAEALCLLLDLETAAPALVSSAMDQLGLDPERRAKVLPLVEEIVQARVKPVLGLDRGTEVALDQQARRLTRIEPGERRSFAELAGFDLRLDDRAQETITTVCSGIRDTDGTMAEITCLTNLVLLQPNPEVAEAFVNAATAHATELVVAGRWADVATVLEGFARVNGSLRERRPEVTALVESALLEFATPEFVGALMTRHQQGNSGEAVALRVIDAVGPAIAPALLELLQSDAAAGGVAVGLMCERAPLFAPTLADSLATLPRGARHHVARVLGHAGAGYEDVVGALIDPADERTAREALRALSRIATAPAADHVAASARTSRGWLTTATIEALLRFPVEAGAPAIRDLLAHRPFVLANPEAASRVIARVAQGRVANLEPVLRDVWSLRYRFWNRALVRTARDAGALINR